ncbi:restriction endonuclease subunit S [Megalodesulfovibrio paquesii]
MKAVPSTWLESNGRRLDCGPYMSGAVEAKELLKKMKAESLSSLTSGHNGGIYNGPQFVRNYVDDPAYGVPFLTTSTMLQADMTNLPMISAKDAHSPKLSYLKVEEGMTLITCSGSIGRMAYARQDMADCWSNQDIMKVVADPNKISPGYLYAFLSSRFGIPIIVSGTYGAIIQHIEPHHIADLPVPRLGDAIEQQAHALVEEAAAKRVAASKAVTDGIALLSRSAGLRVPGNAKHDGIPFGFSAVSSAHILKRMDGGFHSPFHQEVITALGEASVPMTTVSAMAQSIFEPKRFKRVQVDDPEHGIPFFGTTALMWAEPQAGYLIPKRMEGVEQLLVDQKTVLIPRSGQIAGIIGIAVLPYGSLTGGAVSEDAIRIHCNTDIVSGFLFIWLRSEYGLRQLKTRAYGSSIPHLDVAQIGQVLIPNFANNIIEQVGDIGLQSAKLRHEAIDCENQARALVERAIEEGGR